MWRNAVPGEHTHNEDGSSTKSALESLAAMASAEVAGALVIAQPDKRQPEIAQLSPTKAATASLGEVLASIVETYVECAVIPYNPAALLADHEIMCIELERVPLLQTIAARSDDLANLPPFDPDSSKLRDVRLIALRVEANNRSAVFVQSFSSGQVVARSRSRTGLMMRRGILDVPNGGELVLLRQDVAAVVVDDLVLFRNRSEFQKLFGFLDELKQQAKTTFVDVTANLRIAGIEQMELAVTGSPSMLGKMASIKRKVEEHPQYKDALTMPKLLEFIRSHPNCGVDIDGAGKTAQLVFHNDSQHRFKILKLLDDDYLKSDLTTLEYEANSKGDPLPG